MEKNNDNKKKERIKKENEPSLLFFFSKTSLLHYRTLQFGQIKKRKPIKKEI
jgi:hypothetical protein